MNEPVLCQPCRNNDPAHCWGKPLCQSKAAHMKSLNVTSEVMTGRPITGEPVMDETSEVVRRRVVYFNLRHRKSNRRRYRSR